MSIKFNRKNPRRMKFEKKKNNLKNYPKQNK